MPSFKPYYLGARSLNSVGYYVAGSDGRGISGVDMGLSPDVETIDIVGASIRVLGWTSATAGQVQMSVQIDHEQRYQQTSGTLGSDSALWRVTHGLSGAFEGDSSGWTGLIGMDLQGGRAGDTYRIAHFDPIPFHCQNDRIYMEFGGSGGSTLLPVYGLIWRGPKPVSAPWACPVQSPPPTPGNTLGTWSKPSTGIGRSLGPHVNAPYGWFRFPMAQAGSITSVRIKAVTVYTAGSWIAQLCSDNGSGQPGSLVASSSPVAIEAAGEYQFSMNAPVAAGGWGIVLAPVSGSPALDLDACLNDAGYLSGRGASMTATMAALPNNDDWRLQIGWTP